MRIRQKRRQADALGRLLLLVGVFVLLGALLLGGGLVFGRLGQVQAAAGEADADLNPLQRAALTLYLALYADDVLQPAGADATPQAFTIAPGETADAVGARLAEAGLVRDARLLTFYLRYSGLDQSVEAGDFILRQTMNIPEVARALTDAAAREISVRLPEGWRREQIAEALAADPRLNIPAEDWLTLTGPDTAAAAGFGLAADLPPGATLEGFLYPDTYLVRPGASARDVLTKALAAFEKQVTPDLRTTLSTRRLTLYQAVIIASLIEREAVLDEERPVIASVILNRLAIGQPLQIDATTQYGLAAAGNWWPRVAGLDLSAVDHPFNTYRIPALPPAPISNVRAASLRAVAEAPATTYYYYRAACDGSGRHNFAHTYDEHLANACP